MNNLEFQKSITRELDVIKNRVRNLIGNAHWGEEGRFKEAILKTIINRFLPNNLSIGTGFISGELGLGDSMISNQLDLIIYENSIPVLFKEGDFIITTEKNVRGIIEVKSRLDTTNLRKTVDDFNSLAQFPLIANNGENRIFKGLFAYENGINNIENNLTFETLLKDSRGNINHISAGKNYFVRYWRNNNNLFPPVNMNNPFYSLYDIDELSFSYFISNLIHITADQELNDRYQFSFPIEGTKEICRKKTIEIPGRQ